MVNKLTQLLKDDDAGWYEAARWIDSRALEYGFDLGVNFDSAERFAESLMEGMRFHVSLKQQFPNGLADFENHEFAEELFWCIMPTGILSKD